MRLLICTQIVDRDDPILGFFHRWVEEFAKECESVIVICLREGKHSLPSNVRVLSLGKESGISRLKYLFNFYSYIWNERKQYDAVFVHMNQVYVLLGAPLWRLWGKHIGLWYVHRSVTMSLRLATFLVDWVFTTSPESFRISTLKRLTLGHGIDMSLFKPQAHMASRVLSLGTVGRIAKTKNIHAMILVVEKLRLRGVEVTLSIVGSGVLPADRVYEEDLHRLAAAHSLETVVRFEGSVTQEALPSTYAALDVFLNLSATGSMDKAVLEALACGVPVVTTNAAFKDLLLPYGLFVEGMDPGMLADAINHARGMDITPLIEKVRMSHSLSRLIPLMTGILAH